MNLSLFWNLIKETMTRLFSYSNIMELPKLYQQTNGNYTLKLISVSLLLTICLLALYTYFFPNLKNKTIVKFIQSLEDIESLPVVGIVFFIHWFSVIIYKETSFYHFKTVWTPREPAIVVPIIILSIFLVIFLIKYMTH